MIYTFTYNAHMFAYLNHTRSSSQHRVCMYIIYKNSIERTQTCLYIYIPYESELNLIDKRYQQ